MSEGEQEREAVGGVNSQCARLRIAQPAFGNQIVEEGMKSLFTDMWCLLPGKREGDGRKGAGEIGFTIGEDTTTPGSCRSSPAKRSL